MAVIKRDGKRQAFMPGKVRKAVDMAARDAKLPMAKRKELVKEVAEPVIKHYKNKSVRVSALRKAILGRLERRSKAASAAWKRYDRKRRK